MENKKNLNVDINKKRPTFLLIGLTLSLAFTLAAFEWKQLDSGELMDLGTVQDPFDEMVDIPPTEQPPPKAPIVQPQIIVVEDDEEIDEEIIIEIDIDLTEDQIVEDVVFENIEEEVAEDIFIMAPEIQASFGNEASDWNKFLRKNLKYPKRAQRMVIEGKVFLRFIVDKNGIVSDIKVTRGIGGGCDEEAIRVLEKSPRWNPGKQRGRAVKSPMSLAIIFRLR